MKPLAILATHPIQYYVPLYRVAARLLGGRLKVFYHHLPDARQQSEEFDQPFQWDVDLRSGYAHAAGQEGIAGLWKGIARRDWSAVLLHGWHHAFYREAVVRARWNRVPILVRGDSHLRTPRSAGKKWIKRALYPWFFRQIQVFLAVGKWNAEYYRHYGVPDTRIVMSPHCVDNEWCRRETAKWHPDRMELRRAWGVGPDEKVFLYVGKLVERKRVGDLIAALADCRARNRRIRGVVVGEGPLRKGLEEQARSAGIDARFAGFVNQSEICKAYVAADCLWLGSGGEETWGLVVNEALACGLPCVVSDQVGCAVDMIVPGINGAIYPCGDVAALGDRILAIAEGRICFEKAHPAWHAVLDQHSCEAAAQGIARALEAGIR